MQSPWFDQTCHQSLSKTISKESENKIPYNSTKQMRDIKKKSVRHIIISIYYTGSDSFDTTSTIKV